MVVEIIDLRIKKWCQNNDRHLDRYLDLVVELQPDLMELSLEEIGLLRSKYDRLCRRCDRITHTEHIYLACNCFYIGLLCIWVCFTILSCLSAVFHFPLPFGIIPSQPTAYIRDIFQQIFLFVAIYLLDRLYMRYYRHLIVKVKIYRGFFDTIDRSSTLPKQYI